jgi:hypothetical protein
MCTPSPSDRVVRGRTGPDSAFFRGRPVFAGGMQFESHLGHVFSLVRGLWASECAHIVLCPLGPFLLVAVGVACWLLPSLVSGFGACYLFMDVTGWAT